MQSLSWTSQEYKSLSNIFQVCHKLLPIFGTFWDSLPIDLYVRTRSKTAFQSARVMVEALDSKVTSASSQVDYIRFPSTVVFSHNWSGKFHSSNSTSSNTIWSYHEQHWTKRSCGDYWYPTDNKFSKVKQYMILLFNLFAIGRWLVNRSRYLHELTPWYVNLHILTTDVVLIK